MKAIVTGANGFIGSALVNKLLMEGNEVVAIDISFNYNNFLNNNNIVFIESSLDNLDKILYKIESLKADVMYNFAWKGVNGLLKSDPYTQIDNIKMTINCANIAKKTGCKRFLCAGTISEIVIKSLPNLRTVPGSMMYGVAKHCTNLILETYCNSIDLPMIWMTFSNIYGPNNKTGNLISYTISELLKGKEAVFGTATQPYDFIYIDDLIEAIYLLGIKNTKYNSYFIGSGSPRILREYLMEIGRILKKENLIKIGGRDDDGIKYDYSMFDISKLVEDIGVYVKVDFSDGIKSVINAN